MMSLRDRSPSRQRRRQRRGQSLVEFALILPIFLFMVFGVLDMGRFVYMNSTLSQAAREAARVVSVEASWVGEADPGCNQVGGPTCPADLTELRAHALDAANRMMQPFGQITDAELHLSCDPDGSAPTGGWSSPPLTCDDRDPKDVVSVRVVLVFQPITPVIGTLFASITSTASATMVIN